MATVFPVHTENAHSNTQILIFPHCMHHIINQAYPYQPYYINFNHIKFSSSTICYFLSFVVICLLKNYYFELAKMQLGSI